jgi:hypothetical protein
MSNESNESSSNDSSTSTELDSRTETVEKSDPVVSFSGITEKKFNIQQSQEITRSILAGFLMFLLGVSIFGIGIFIWNIKDTQDSKELITLVWTSQVTLTIGALAYYFASNKN